jgi:hypothetical protein
MTRNGNGTAVALRRVARLGMKAAHNAAAREGAVWVEHVEEKRNIVEEEYPSLAGLAATYSSKS